MTSYDGMLEQELLPAPFEWCSIPAGTATIATFGMAEVGPFEMAKYPVTVAQFDYFTQATDGYADARWWDGLAKRRMEPAPQSYDDSRVARVFVDWYECVAFCRWLGQRLCCDVRLPTEWEWQWAASGSCEGDYPWGESFRSSLCNTKECGLATVTPVDMYPEGASRFGVMDLSGNVWERCLGVFDNPANVAINGVSNRTIHGGSWRYSRAEAKIRYRQLCIADRRFDDGGFRIIRIVSPSRGCQSR
jgi:formylglycine-generating enzyme required for sulfatase activity